MNASECSTGGVRFMDCNCRIGTFEAMEPAQFTDLESLLSEMQYVGIAEAVVMHTWSSRWSPRKGNEKIDELISGHDNLYPCYVGLPGATEEIEPPAAFADRAKANRGVVRLFPVEHQWDFAEWCAGDLLSALADRAVPVMIDIKQTSWSEVAAVIARYDQLPVIILDTSYRIDRHIYPLFAQHQNLYLETHTYQIPWGIEDVCRRFGADRLIFGTDLPEISAGGAIAQVMYADISEDEKRQMAGGTLRRLLGIAPC